MDIIASLIIKKTCLLTLVFFYRFEFASSVHQSTKRFMFDFQLPGSLSLVANASSHLERNDLNILVIRRFLSGTYGQIFALVISFNSGLMSVASLWSFMWSSVIFGNCGSDISYSCRWSTEHTVTHL